MIHCDDDDLRMCDISFSFRNVHGDTSVTGIMDVCTAFPSFVVNSPANMPLKYVPQ